MAHDTALPRQRHARSMRAGLECLSPGCFSLGRLLLGRAPIALLLGALACGDDGALSIGEAGAGATAPEAVAPAPGASSGGAASEAAPAAPGSSPAAATDGSGEAGAGPIMLAPTAPSNDGSSESAAGNGAAGNAQGAAEPGAEAPVAEVPVADESPGEAPAPEPSTDATPEEDPSQPAPSGGALDRGDAPTRASAIGRGPFEVQVVTTGLRDGPDYGSQTLFVPADVEPPLAAVAIIPGRDEEESSIAAWGPFLASHGIVALTFGTNDPGDDPDVRALALLDALQTIRAENTRAGGPLDGKLALDHLGVMGWSAGGAAVLSVASSTPTLRAAVALAPFSPGGQFPEDQVPTLFIAGSDDPRAGGQSQGVFESIPESTSKLLFEVEGGVHEVGNDPENASGEVGLYGLSWLEVFLVGDQRYRQFLEATPTQASDYRASLGSAP